MTNGERILQILDINSDDYIDLGCADGVVTLQTTEDFWNREYSQKLPYLSTSSLVKGARIVESVGEVIKDKDEASTLVEEYNKVADDLRNMNRDVCLKVDGAYEDGYEHGYHQAEVDLTDTKNVSIQDFYNFYKTNLKGKFYCENVEVEDEVYLERVDKGYDHIGWLGYDYERVVNSYRNEIKKTKITDSNAIQCVIGLINNKGWIE